MDISLQNNYEHSINLPKFNVDSNVEYTNYIKLSELIDKYDIDSVIVDLDETLIHSEHVQQRIWSNAVIFLSSDKNVNVDIDNLSTINNDISMCFKTGKMDQLLPCIFNGLKKYINYDNVLDIDNDLLPYRLDALKYCCLSKEIYAYEGATQLLNILSYNYGNRIALYTSNNRITGELLLNNIFGKEYIDGMIPECNRLYGDELGHISRKPDPFGFLYCAQKSGFNPEKTMIIDDSEKVINNINDNGKFKLNIGISYDKFWDTNDWKKTKTYNIITQHINNIK